MHEGPGSGNFRFTPRGVFGAQATPTAPRIPARRKAVGGEVLSRIRKFLDLSNRHLPANVAYSLSTYDGVTAHEFTLGWLVWVPPDPQARAAEAYVPAELLRIQRFARARDCDYLLFDRDAPLSANFPFWEW